MSIATLKKLTAAKYNHQHVQNKNSNYHDGYALNGARGGNGLPIFSINGTRRSQGYVGQDMRGRTILKTPMKGNVICGHGGHDGAYVVHPIIQSGVLSLNNTSVVKKSVLGTTGQLATQYRWIRRPAPYATVKPDSSNNINSHGQLINTIKSEAIANAKTCANSKTTVTVCVCKPLGSDLNYNYNKFSKHSIIGDPSKIGAQSQSNYIENSLYSKCFLSES